jgi:phosphoglycolate phosphatase
MKMLADATIAFDLDGTLADTAPDIAVALNHTLTAAGAAPFTLEDVRAMIGGGVRALITRACARRVLAYSSAHIDTLTSLFVEAYQGRIAQETQPFPDVVEALGELRAAGATLCVCTNKRTDLARELLDALDLSHFFSAIVGPDSSGASKPDPKHLMAAIAAAGGSVSHALMVGDSNADLAAARALSVPCVVVTFGYEPDAAAAADMAISSYRDLFHTCANLLGQRPA